jgi:hypothetical protein
MAKTSATKCSKDKSPEEAQPPCRELAGQSVSSVPTTNILDLQRAAGNRAVSRLLQSQMENRHAGDSVLTITHAGLGGIQPKLEVSYPQDKYEQEADRVADQVMRMQKPGASAQALTTDRNPATQVQRKCIGCEEEASRAGTEGDVEGQATAIDIDMPIPGVTLEEESSVPVSTPNSGSWIQRMCAEGQKEIDLPAKGTPGQTVVNSSAVQDFPGGGRPLDASVRAFFEPRFGQAFDQVRVHTDVRATESARAVNALAYTRGRDIVFGAGQYAPETMAGRRLLAHELTHVMQQNPSHPSTKSPEPRNGSVPIQAMKSGSTTLQRKVVTGDPISGINTIVCDGKGRIRVQLGGTGNAVQAECLSDCMTQHELSHKTDALADNAKICEGQGANRIVTWDTQAERNVTEIKSSNVEIDCLKAKKASDKCNTIVKDRIKQMEAYRDSFK